MFQTTINKSLFFSGVGLHSGEEMSLTLMPAPHDSGVQFRRIDVLNCPYVRVSPYNVTSTTLATAITCGDFPISTIEHLMSALYALGVDNVYIDVMGSEVPIMDGSSLPFVEEIIRCGLTILDVKRKYLKVTEPIYYEVDDMYVGIEPSNSFNITFEIDYPHKAIGSQVKTISLSSDLFINELSSARTFGFKKDVDMLMKMGLAKGGSMDNAVVLDDLSDKVLNPEGLRCKDEFVNHKILDLIGDLSLIGYHIIGDVFAKKSGHKLNNIFARRLLQDTSAYFITDRTPYVYGLMDLRVPETI